MDDVFEFHIPRRSTVWVLRPGAKAPEDADVVEDYGWFQIAFRQEEEKDGEVRISDRDGSD